MKNEKLIYSILIGFLIVFTLFFIIVYFKLKPTRECHELNRIKKIDLIGTISNKYYDRKNHNYETLEITNNSSLIKKYFVIEKSGFYNYVQEGDSIYKPKNSINIVVIRGNSTRKFKLNYGCEEK